MSKISPGDAGSPERHEQDGENLDGGSSNSHANNPDETIRRNSTEDYSSPVVTDSGPNPQASFHEKLHGENKVKHRHIVLDEADLEKYCKYKMNHSKRGIAIIFNNENFKHDTLKQRVGAAEDGTALSNTLVAIGFEVRLHNDKNLDEMWEEIHKVAEEDHTNHDCLLIAFMTHGNENGEIYATDRIFRVEDVFEKFKSDKVPSLAGKPKIFLLQACRGKKMDESVDALRNIQNSVTTDSYSARYVSLPPTADFLFLYSSMEGYASCRSTTKGSWFIQDLCKELEKDARTKDLLSIVTNTLKRVALTRCMPDGTQTSELHQMPVFMSTLTRFLYFYES